MPKMRESIRTPLPAAPERHTHRFEVETDTDAVHLSIGRPDPEAAGQAAQSAHAAVAGGYLKVFNRLIDTGAWARLPDAARAVYLPLCRFADAREDFRTRAGLAALMRHTGLSRSSVKRGLRALQDARLLAVVRAGGVAADGTNLTNVYQLLVPDADEPQPLRGAPAEAARKPVQSAARAKRAKKTDAPAAHAPAAPAGVIAATPAFFFSCDSYGDRPADAAAPEGVRPRTPGRAKADPPAGPAREPRPRPSADPAAGPAPAGTESGSGPLIRPISSESISPAQAPADVVGEEDEDRNRPAASLQRWGVHLTAARDLAERFGPDAVRAATAAVEPLARAGRVRNAAGWLVRHLERGWGDPADAPAAADLAARTAADRVGREAEAAQAVAARESADAVLDALDDATLGVLAGRVVASHADRPAMIRLLTAKPPRQSRLMRAEIAALLQAGPQRGSGPGFGGSARAGPEPRCGPA